MSVTGYPIEDLAESRHFVEATVAATARLTAIEGNAGILFGTLIDRGPDSKPSNGACLVDPLYDPETRKIHQVIKYELPNYGVFDEKRIFEPAAMRDVYPIAFRGKPLGVMICEDTWFPTVTNQLVKYGAEILISINGSPFEIGKDQVRLDVATDRRVGNDLPLLYVNLVGGQDELVFDGGSFLLDGNGLTQYPAFEEGWWIADVMPGTKAFESGKSDKFAAIYRACVLGLRDYMAKQNFTSVVLGMSGGVDSGIVAAMACDAIGPDKVNLVRLPSKYSSDGSLVDAAEANDRLGTKMRTIEIENIVNALREAYSSAQIGHLDPPVLTGVADENIQARARGTVLMAISNQEGHLLLTTGNKSEVSVGYSTLYGDMAGGFNPIKDCYKTTVWALCRYRNALTRKDLDALGFLGRVAEVVPEAIIVKPPSAELRPDQKDEDSLPPYPVLDDILERMIEKRQSTSEIALHYPRETVFRVRGLVDRAEYKRRQAAPGVKITSKLHGRERRVPIVNHFTPNQEAI
jgi:NAD+ synthase